MAAWRRLSALSHSRTFRRFISTWFYVSVAEATAGTSLDGGNIALVIFILVLLLSVLLGGAYVYATR